MLATTIDEPDIPPLWYPAVQQIQATAEIPRPSYLNGLEQGFYSPGTSSTVSTHVVQLLEIEQLGWSAVEALETHLRFRSFAEDWDAPGMEAYDEL